jgi:hypothetical protein
VAYYGERWRAADWAEGPRPCEYDPITTARFGSGEMNLRIFRMHCCGLKKKDALLRLILATREILPNLKWLHFFNGSRY